MEQFLKAYVPSTEAVGIDNVLFKMLTVVMKQLKSGDIQMTDVNANFKDIFEEPGISLSIEYLDYAGLGAFIEVPVLSNNAATTNRVIQDMTKNREAMAIFGTSDVTFAGIDRANGKLSGFYSKIPFKLYLTELAVANLSPEQLAALCLHEVGHIWSYCELLTYGVVTNQALKTARDAFLSRDTNEKLKILRIVGDTDVSYAQVDGLDEKQYLDQIAVRVSHKLDIARENGDSNWYDRSTFEYLADQYAVRQGAGAHLVSALELIRNDIASETFYATKIGAALASTVKMGLLILGTPYVTGPILLALGIMGRTTVLNDSGTYDTAPDRYRRIIQSAIGALKNRNISRELRRSTLEDIVLIEKVLGTLNSSVSINHIAKHIFIGKYRRGVREKLRQQELEALANNDLYRQSASLLN